jgi:hypothetical protein|tara:strand:- start:769 stop:966 length:198 start_codon:yes stop_codon:yes gene_type:complete
MIEIPLGILTLICLIKLFEMAANLDRFETEILTDNRIAEERLESIEKRIRDVLSELEDGRKVNKR